jgi:hypothetical protein
MNDDPKKIVTPKGSLNGDLLIDILSGMSISSDATMHVSKNPAYVSDPDNFTNVDQIQFVNVVKESNPADGSVAKKLVIEALKLIGLALDLYHQTVAQVAVGTFHRDVPPGMKSAEATKAWLGTHLNALKGRTGEYTGGNDLLEAVILTASELNRACSIAECYANLNASERVSHAFRDALSRLGGIVQPSDTVPVRIAQFIGNDSSTQNYWSGTQVIIEKKPSSTPAIIVAGILVTLLLIK